LPLAARGALPRLATLAQLRFQDGHLVDYFAHRQKVRPTELAVFDESVERLVGWAHGAGAGNSAGSGRIRRLT